MITFTAHFTVKSHSLSFHFNAYSVDDLALTDARHHHLGGGGKQHFQAGSSPEGGAKRARMRPMSASVALVRHVPLGTRRLIGKFGTEFSVISSR